MPRCCRLNKSITILLTVAALSIAIPAFAKPCSPSTASATAELPGGYYLVNDVCQFQGCLISTLVYQETNGLDGLQRADAQVDNTCAGGHGQADRRIV